MSVISLTHTSAAASIAANSNKGEAAVPAVQAEAPIPPPTMSTAFSKNADRFGALTATISDMSGKYSDDERLQAYASLFEMGVRGELRGMDAGSAKLYSKTIMESDIGVRARQLQEREVAVIGGAVANGQSPALAQLKFIAGLSESDQKRHFTVTANGFGVSGSRQYANFDAYRDQLVGNAAHDFNDRNDPHGAERALKSLSSAMAGDNWGASILSLFSAMKSGASDSSLTGAVGQARGQSALPPLYQPGNIRELLA